MKTENDHINLKVAGQDGSVVQFKIKRHTPLSKLMKAYCERQVCAGQRRSSSRAGCGVGSWGAVGGAACVAGLPLLPWVLVSACPSSCLSLGSSTCWVELGLERSLVGFVPDRPS